MWMSLVCVYVRVRAAGTLPCRRRGDACLRSHTIILQNLYRKLHFAVVRCCIDGTLWGTGILTSRVEHSTPIFYFLRRLSSTVKKIEQLNKHCYEKPSLVGFQVAVGGKGG